MTASAWHDFDTESATHYVIVRTLAQYPAVADTCSVVVLGSHENLSHHESESAAHMAVKGYKAADRRRA